MMKTLWQSSFLIPVLAWSASLTTPTPSTAVDSASVWNHIHQHYVHGLPYGATEDLGPDAVTFLLPMLDDPAEEEWWYNVVTALGIVGQADVTDPLIEFFEKWGTQELSRETFRAVTSVPAALGLVAAKGDPVALEYVKACTRLEFLEERSRWTALDMNPETLHTLLIQIAIKGLGFAGTSDALAHLRAMEQGPESPALAAALRPDLIEAIQINQQIANRGPRSFFEPAGRVGR